MSTRLAAGAVVTALTLGLSACGGESKPKPMDAVTKMQAQLKTYKSVDMTVAGTQAGHAMTLNLHGPVMGNKSAGSITVDGNSAQMIQADNAAYLKASAAYYKKYTKPGQLDASALFGDKWVKESSQASKNLIKDYVDALGKEKPSGKPNTFSASDTEVTSDKFENQDAWKLTTKDAKHTLWVKKGSFDLLKVTGANLSATGQKWESTSVAIHKHDEPENITAPTDAVDLSQLGK